MEQCGAIIFYCNIRIRRKKQKHFGEMFVLCQLNDSQGIRGRMDLLLKFVPPQWQPTAG
jgi:hypothetical protein